MCVWHKLFIREELCENLSQKFRNELVWSSVSPESIKKEERSGHKSVCMGRFQPQNFIYKLFYLDSQREGFTAPKKNKKKQRGVRSHTSYHSLAFYLWTPHPDKTQRMQLTLIPGMPATFVATPKVYTCSWRVGGTFPFFFSLFSKSELTRQVKWHTNLQELQLQNGGGFIMFWLYEEGIFKKKAQNNLLGDLFIEGKISQKCVYTEKVIWKRYFIYVCWHLLLLEPFLDTKWHKIRSDLNVTQPIKAQHLLCWNICVQNATSSHIDL